MTTTDIDLGIVNLSSRRGFVPRVEPAFTETQKRYALMEACGWNYKIGPEDNLIGWYRLRAGHKIGGSWRREAFDLHSLPDMEEAEESLWPFFGIDAPDARAARGDYVPPSRGVYTETLSSLLDRKVEWPVVDVPPEIRAEALLFAFGKISLPATNTAPGSLSALLAHNSH